jgi:GT2 family glycosyltransferase
MKVIAVIVSHNRKDLLIECIESLLSGNVVPDEIVVVDNDSTDGSAEWLVTNKAIRPHLLSSNKGGSFAFSYGFKKAYEFKADWIWSMDEDVLVTPNALKELINFSKSAANYGFVVPQVLSKNGKINQNSHPEFDKNKNVKTATFIGTFTRSKALLECGFPISNMFRYFDDLEFFLRLYQHNFIGGYCIKSEVIHLSEGIDMNEYYLNLRSNRNAQLFLTNLYFYLRRKNGTKSTLLFMISDLIFKKKKLKLNNPIKDFSKMKILIACIKSLTFRPKY